MSSRFFMRSTGLVPVKMDTIVMDFEIVHEANDSLLNLTAEGVSSETQAMPKFGTWVGQSVSEIDGAGWSS